MGYGQESMHRRLSQKHGVKLQPPEISSRTNQSAKVYRVNSLHTSNSASIFKAQDHSEPSDELPQRGI